MTRRTTDRRTGIREQRSEKIRDAVPEEAWPLGLSSARCLELAILSFVPMQNPQSAEGIPAARFAHGLAERQGERLVVRSIEEPSTVGLAFAFEDAHGIADARVGGNIVVNTGSPEVVE